MPTSNVIVNRSGTGYTINVTPCNLLSNINIRDFIVLHDGTLYGTQTHYTKTSPTVITYNGPSIPNTLIEVRRLTPESVLIYEQASYLKRLTSDAYNTQMDRWLRRFEEANLNGIGPGSIVTVQTPKDDPFGIIWDGDTVYPPTRNAVYDEMILKAPLNSPAFTGNPTAPNQPDLSGNQRIANTLYVDTRTGNALANSPNLGGNPTSTTPPTADNSTRIATTAWVRNWADASPSLTTPSISSPSMTGTPTAPTASRTTNTTQVATTAFAQSSRVFRKYGHVERLTELQITTVLPTWTEIMSLSYTPTSSSGQLIIIANVHTNASFSGGGSPVIRLRVRIGSIGSPTATWDFGRANPFYTGLTTGQDIIGSAGTTAVYTHNTASAITIAVDGANEVSTGAIWINRTGTGTRSALLVQEAFNH